MATIDHLQLATWQATPDATPWGLSRYQMPAAVHATLTQWQQPRGAGAAPLGIAIGCAGRPLAWAMGRGA